LVKKNDKIDPDLQQIVDEAVAKAKVQKKDPKQISNLVNEIIDKMNEPESEYAESIRHA
jgi:hypothetical protein